MMHKPVAVSFQFRTVAYSTPYSNADDVSIRKRKGFVAARAKSVQTLINCSNVWRGRVGQELYRGAVILVAKIGLS